MLFAMQNRLWILVHIPVCLEVWAAMGIVRRVGKANVPTQVRTCLSEAGEVVPKARASGPAP